MIQGQDVEDILQSIVYQIEVISRSFIACTLFLEVPAELAMLITRESGKLHSYARALDFGLQMCVTTSHQETQVSLSCPCRSVPRRTWKIATGMYGRR